MNVLVIDDAPDVAIALKGLVQKLGHSSYQANTRSEAEKLVGQRAYDLIFLDYMLGPDRGTDLIEPILREQPHSYIVMITAHASLDVAVSAMKKGVRDVLKKPFSLSDLEIIIERVSSTKRLENRLEALEREVGLEDSFTDSQSDYVRNLLEMAKRAAATDSVILLTGESGTGKTQLAKLIHQWSPRHGNPFGVVACPSLSAELLESELFGHVKGAFTGAVSNNPGRVSRCEGGTIFLDEIGTLPLRLQPKLLRFLQDLSYERVGDTTTYTANVRVVAATNLDLRKSVAEGSFREDLYYRLNVVELKMLPLRERLEDMGLLAQFMLDRLCVRHNRPRIQLSSTHIVQLRSYQWPGNLRQLHNVLERALIFSPVADQYRLVLPEAEPLATDEEGAPQLGGDFSLSEIESAHIQSVLRRAGSREEAARILGINPTTLWRRSRKSKSADFRSNPN